MGALWSYYTESNMQPDRFYYYHVMHLSTLLLGIDTQFCRDRADEPALMWLGWAIVVLMVCAGRSVVVIIRPPFIAAKTWMIWPEVFVLVSLALLRTTVLALYSGSADWMVFVTVMMLGITVPLIMGSFVHSLHANFRSSPSLPVRSSRSHWMHNAEWTSNPLQPRTVLHNRKQANTLSGCLELFKERMSLWIEWTAQNSHRWPFAFTWRGGQARFARTIRTLTLNYKVPISSAGGGGLLSSGCLLLRLASPQAIWSKTAFAGTSEALRPTESAAYLGTSPAGLVGNFAIVIVMNTALLPIL